MTGQDCSSNPQECRAITAPWELREGAAMSEGLKLQAPLCVNPPFPNMPTDVWSEKAENKELKAKRVRDCRSMLGW